MELFFLSLIFFTVAFSLMAVGAITRGKCLKGTCGGANQRRDKDGIPTCDACLPRRPSMGK